MQKIILITSILFGTLQAQELTTSQTMKLLNYNRSSYGKIKYKRVLKRLSNIKEDKAKEIATDRCKESVNFSKLRHHSNRLFYTMKTKTCTIKIDALDGTIIEKKSDR